MRTTVLLTLSLAAGLLSAGTALAATDRADWQLADAFETRAECQVVRRNYPEITRCVYSERHHDYELWVRYP